MHAPHNVNLADDVLGQFARFMSDNLSLPAFEQWVYSTPYMANVIGDNHYFHLLNFDYHLPSSTDELQRWVTQLANQFFPSELVREQIRLLLCGLMTGSLNVFDATDTLTWWRNQGVDWIPAIFAGIQSELDNAPHPAHYHLWEPQALAAKLAEVEAWVAHYRTLAEAEARKLLAAEFPNRSCQ